jgi:hypothetical protein
MVSTDEGEAAGGEESVGEGAEEEGVCGRGAVTETTMSHSHLFN